MFRGVASGTSMFGHLKLVIKRRNIFIKSNIQFALFLSVRIRTYALEPVSVNFISLVSMCVQLTISVNKFSPLRVLSASFERVSAMVFRISKFRFFFGIVVFST